ncbi:hypothetical protein F4680DRAFT_464537 [Xylaria scruposa]|nr:hypothetical protein F4680DRAFT_464537 [Xylaria scruposa]
MARIRKLLLNLPNELIHMIIEFMVIESDPNRRLFWCIRSADSADDQDQSLLADLLQRDHCQYHYLEVLPATTDRVRRQKYKEMLRAQYEVYTTIRGNKIGSLVRVSRIFKRIIERHYVFLEPYQKRKSGISSSLGYWINHEHDVIMPATDNRFLIFNPPGSESLRQTGQHDLRELSTPPLTSSFPWSRVRNLHLPGISRSLEKLKEVIPYLPNLEYICIRYPFTVYTAVCPRSNPHTTTMDSIKRREKFLTFEDQGWLGTRPLAGSSRPVRGPLENNGDNIREVQELCKARGIMIVELDNTCGDCPQYDLQDNAREATARIRKMMERPDQRMIQDPDRTAQELAAAEAWLRAREARRSLQQ